MKYMSKNKIRTKPMTLDKFIWYCYSSCQKHNLRITKKLNSIKNYHLDFMSAGGWWGGK